MATLRTGVPGGGRAAAASREAWRALAPRTPSADRWVSDCCVRHSQAAAGRGPNSIRPQDVRGAVLRCVSALGSPPSALRSPLYPLSSILICPLCSLLSALRSPLSALRSPLSALHKLTGSAATRLSPAQTSDERRAQSSLNASWLAGHTKHCLCLVFPLPSAKALPLPVCRHCLCGYRVPLQRRRPDVAARRPGGAGPVRHCLHQLCAPTAAAAKKVPLLAVLRRTFAETKPCPGQSGLGQLAGIISRSLLKRLLESERGAAAELGPSLPSSAMWVASFPRTHHTTHAHITPHHTRTVTSTLLPSVLCICCQSSI